jgi:S-formylglutathione hydrolase FrmB
MGGAGRRWTAILAALAGCALAATGGALAAPGPATAATGPALATPGPATAATGPATATPGPATAATVPAFHDGAGLHVASERALDARLLALSVTTPALTGSANVRVLLPAGYGAHPNQRYPVLYLLHGTSGGAADWTTMGGAEATTAGLPLIVVMPDIAQNDDGGGWCTDWYNGGSGGIPQWERFHIDELVPWVDANLRTIPSRNGRAIAGLSQGGFCSMSYAARHPDMFASALSYSGAPDIAYDAEAQTLVTPVINATETGLDGVAPYSMFGLRQTEEVNWAAHDPATLAPNLADTRLLMYTGNGQPGPLDSAVPNPGAMAIESGVEQLTALFHDRLQALGIASVFRDYGGGTHSWPYWARDLQWSIGWVMAGFAHPPAAPAAVSYMSADPTYGAYGWTVATHRAVREFSSLRGAGAAGFTLAGSGAATVTTPAVYRRRHAYRVTVTTSGARRTTIARTGSGRRLRIHVTLGPSDTVQQYPLDGPSPGTHVYTSRVTIAAARAARPVRRGSSGAGRRPTGR